MNPFQTATEEGYDNERIFDFLYKSYPQVRKKLKKAINQGYTAKEVIDFFANQARSQKEYGNLSQQAVHSEKRQEDTEKNIDLIKGGLKLASNLALPLGIGQGASKIGQGIAKGLTNIVQKSIPQQIAQQAAPTIVSKATTSAVKPQLSALLSKHGLLNKIESLASKNAPETIGALLQKQVTAEGMQEIEQASGKSFAETMKDYAETFLKKAGKGDLSRESLRHQIQTTEERVNETPQSSAGGIVRENAPTVQEGLPAIGKEQELQKPRKRTALLSDGQTGIIRSEKQGITEIETPSGIRRKKLDELILEPEEAAVQARELIKSFTPEQERSTHHAISFYDADDKSAYFMFHNGSAYKVDDISSDEYERLSTETDMAKTTGKSGYGAWATGEGSRGAAYNEIVKKLKKPYKKLQVGYNILKEWQRLNAERDKKERRKKPE